MKAYPMLDREKLKTELILLYSQRDLYPSNKLVDWISSLLSDMLRQDVFPELLKLLKIVLTIPMTTAEPEHCFSTLKRKKHFFGVQQTLVDSLLWACSQLLMKRLGKSRALMIKLLITLQQQNHVG